ncbi:hypothetical protein HDU87_006318 [Geranomyces variabilis]|uniref:Uncharacterized protein n=1 Tax=Geranomyces variabilis TaxID=109894 RepID=A0AAD5TFH9_9FUNG|nr:hypothetical protein HDU87_006318 [Geranomyces variabilis]
MPGLHPAPAATLACHFSALPPSAKCAAYSDFALRVVLQHGSSVTPAPPADLPTYFFTLFCQNPTAVTIHGLKAYVSSLGLQGLAAASHFYDARERSPLASLLNKPRSCENEQKVVNRAGLPLPPHDEQQKKQQHRILVYTEDYFVVPATLTVADAFVSGELVHIRALDIALRASEGTDWRTDVCSPLKSTREDAECGLQRSKRAAFEDMHLPKPHQNDSAAEEREGPPEDLSVAVCEPTEASPQLALAVCSGETFNAAESADISPAKPKRRKSQRGKRVATTACVDAKPPSQLSVALQTDLNVSPSRAALSPTRKLSDSMLDFLDSVEHHQNDTTSLEHEVLVEDLVPAVSESAEPLPSVARPEPTVCNGETINVAEFLDIAPAKSQRRKGQRGKRAARRDVDSKPQSEDMPEIPTPPSCHPVKAAASQSQPARAASPTEERSPEPSLDAPSASRKKKRGPRRKRGSQHAAGTSTTETPALATARIPTAAPCSPSVPANAAQSSLLPESRKRSAEGDDDKENHATDTPGKHKRKRRRGRRGTAVQTENAGICREQQQQQKTPAPEKAPEETNELAVKLTTAARPSAALSTSASSGSESKQQEQQQGHLEVPTCPAIVISSKPTSRRGKRRSSKHVPLNTTASIGKTSVSPPPLASPSPPPYPAPDPTSLRMLTDALAIADLSEAFLDDIAWVAADADAGAAEKLLDSALDGILERAPGPALAPFSVRKQKSNTAGSGKAEKRGRDPATMQRGDAIWDRF